VTSPTTIDSVETARMSMSSALNSALDVALALDPKVILLGEDIADPAGGVFKTTRGLSTKYGADRVRATPIAEQSIVGAAIGAAMGGFRPVAEVMFFDFMTVCMDQVVNHAAKLRYMSAGAATVPITIRTMIGSSRFGAQHAQELEAWFMHTPGIKVVTASTPADAKGLLLSCIFDPDPCIFVEHSSLVFAEKGPVPTGDHRVPLGVAEIRRPGNNATVVTYGAQVRPAVQAAELLANEGIETEVIDLRSLVPLDMDTVLESVSRTRRAVVLHNATTFCGPGAEIASLITESLFSTLVAPVARLGARNVPIPFAQELSIYPTVEELVHTVQQLCLL
jgi:pyruvate/2-oxoglutarate/acetoin dehydrogenase E1 component